ncbi:MAG: hypothetical protein ACRYFY_17530 [Janthinobacterium lividum]
MSAPEQKRSYRRRNGMVLLFAGAIGGVSALVMGKAARRRLQATGDDPFGEETGRGEHATPPDPQAVKKGFEIEDMSAATMGMLTVGLGVAIAIAIWLMVIMLQGFKADRNEAPPLTAQQTAQLEPPSPRVQNNPLGDIATLRQHELVLLNTYGWVDANHQRARIPIGIAVSRTVGQTLDSAP